MTVFEKVFAFEITGFRVVTLFKRYSRPINSKFEVKLQKM